MLTTYEANEVYIFTDCVAAIDIVKNQSNVADRLECLKCVWSSLKVLERRKVNVTLVWCPGHCDIVYNDMADAEAKRAAEALSNLDNVTET